MAAPLPKKSKRLWEANFGSQTLFLTCPADEACLEGTRGRGATDALLIDFAQHCGRGYGEFWRGVIFRRTFPELADIIARSQRWFSQATPARFNKTENSWTWPTGEVLLFRYMLTPSDYWNYHGHEYPWIGWEEIQTWPTMECYEQMKSCNRCSKPDVPRKIRSTANPYGPGHAAVKAYFIDPAPSGTIFKGPDGATRVAIKGHWAENRALLDAQPDYAQKLKSESDPARTKAWLGGDWNVVAGAAFSDVWSEGRQALRPFPIPSGWKVDRSLDWGSSKPFSVGWWAETDGTDAEQADGTFRGFPPGSLIRIGEWYGRHSTLANVGVQMSSADVGRGVVAMDKEIAAAYGIRSIRPGPADTQIWDAGHDGRTIEGEMRRVGCRWTKAQKGPGSRISGYQLMRDRLRASMVYPDTDEPGLWHFDTCRAFAETVPALPKLPGVDDVDTDAEDHVYDEARYRLSAQTKAWSTGKALGG